MSVAARVTGHDEPVGPLWKTLACFVRGDTQTCLCSSDDSWQKKCIVSWRARCPVLFWAEMRFLSTPLRGGLQPTPSDLCLCQQRDRIWGENELIDCGPRANFNARLRCTNRKLIYKLCLHQHPVTFSAFFHHCRHIWFFTYRNYKHTQSVKATLSDVLDTNRDSKNSWEVK